MTDLHKIESYYSKFDEWGRLDNPEGKLEYDIVTDIISQYLPGESTILDLGGGPGRYTVALSNAKHKMYLADLSADLITIAKEKIIQYGTPTNVIQTSVCNAMDLSSYAEDMFDAVLLFGPLYHLTSASEIKTCLSEVSRVLKKNGKLFAIYIPWISGLTSVLDRSFYAPRQVNADILLKTYADGIFNNKINEGFQEGCYIKTNKILEQLSNAGFDQLLLRSIRGIGYKQEKNILQLQEYDPEYFKIILQIINDTASENAVIETCGHAIFVGEKR